jgi:hypothetical protein
MLFINPPPSCLLACHAHHTEDCNPDHNNLTATYQAQSPDLDDQNKAFSEAQNYNHQNIRV